MTPTAMTTRRETLGSRSVGLLLENFANSHFRCGGWKNVGISRCWWTGGSSCWRCNRCQAGGSCFYRHYYRRRVGISPAGRLGHRQDTSATRRRCSSDSSRPAPILVAHAGAPHGAGPGDAAPGCGRLCLLSVRRVDESPAHHSSADRRRSVRPAAGRGIAELLDRDPARRRAQSRENKVCMSEKM